MNNIRTCYCSCLPHFLPPRWCWSLRHPLALIMCWTTSQFGTIAMMAFAPPANNAGIPTPAIPANSPSLSDIMNTRDYVERLIHDVPFIRPWLSHVRSFVTLHIFFSLCKLHIYCISSLDYTKWFLLLQSFTVFKFRLETEIGSTSLQSWCSPSYGVACSGEWTPFLGDGLMWFLESLGRRSS